MLPLINREKDINIIKIEPVKIPSIPSIKLQKFIIAADPKTIKVNTINFITI